VKGYSDVAEAKLIVKKYEKCDDQKKETTTTEKLPPPTTLKTTRTTTMVVTPKVKEIKLTPNRVKINSQERSFK